MVRQVNFYEFTSDVAIDTAFAKRVCCLEHDVADVGATDRFVVDIYLRVRTSGHGL
jgi:hypothetical protein